MLQTQEIFPYSHQESPLDLEAQRGRLSLVGLEVVKMSSL